MGGILHKWMVSSPVFSLVSSEEVVSILISFAVFSDFLKGKSLEIHSNNFSVGLGTAN